MTISTPLVTASDGVRCFGDSTITAEEVCRQYEAELKDREQQYVDIPYLNTRSNRVSSKYIRLYYHYWTRWSGYGNPLGPCRYIFGLDRVKYRIMRSVVRRAVRNRWYVWRQADVLYIETPQGQCSFHVTKPGESEQRYKASYLRWFRRFPERNDLKWSGVTNSDIVLRRIYGEKTATTSTAKLHGKLVAFTNGLKWVTDARLD